MRIVRSEPPYLGAMTWAQLSAITTSPVGATALVTDWNQPFVYGSDGEWRPVGGSVILAQSGAVLSHTGTTTTTDILTLTVPGGLMGLRGKLVFEAPGSSVASSGTSVQSITWGGVIATTQQSTVNTSLFAGVTIRNAGAANLQRVNGVWNGSTSNALATTTNSQRNADTTAPVNLTLQLTLGGTSAQFVFNGYSLTLYK